jgi:cell division protein FtsL
VIDVLALEPEAGIAALQAEVAAKDARIAEQDVRIEALVRQVAELSERLGRN